MKKKARVKELNRKIATGKEKLRVYGQYDWKRYPHFKTDYLNMSQEVLRLIAQKMDLERT